LASYKTDFVLSLSLSLSHFFFTLADQWN